MHAFRGLIFTEKDICAISITTKFYLAVTIFAVLKRTGLAKQLRQQYWNLIENYVLISHLLLV